MSAAPPESPPGSPPESRPLRVLIVDDEAPARRELLRCLQRSPGVEVIGEASDGVQAVEHILADQPDLVLLDVQMPELNGFEVLEALAPEERPAVIFVTAHDTFALDAFEVQAVDYLLKPFDDERFDVALARARQHLGRPNFAVDQLLERVADSGRRSGRRSRRLPARCGGRLVLLEREAVIRAESARNYVLLHTPAGEHLTRSTLSAVEARLGPDDFVRIHRSHLVRTALIREVRRHSGAESTVLLQDGTELPVGRSHRPGLELRLSDDPA